MNPQHATERLLAARTELEARLDRTHKHIHRNEPMSPNSHEQAVETSNDDVVQALAQEGQQELDQIRKALLRIEKGEYEFCAKCDKPIGEERLSALPWTDVCIKCA